MIEQTLPFCLASSSPRRSDLLKYYGFQFEVYPPDVDETAGSDESPKDYVARLSQDKALKAQKRYPESLVLAGDTVVVKDGKIFGKPKDYEEAKTMLKCLNGGIHHVYSGYCLTSSSQQVVDVVETKIMFYQMNEQWIEAYLATGESFDKAGAYSIQGLGSAFVKWIQGAFDNVVGFPMGQILQDLIQKGWANWKE